MAPADPTANHLIVDSCADERFGPCLHMLQFLVGPCEFRLRRFGLVSENVPALVRVSASTIASSDRVPFISPALCNCLLFRIMQHWFGSLLTVSIRLRDATSSF